MNTQFMGAGYPAPPCSQGYSYNPATRFQNNYQPQQFSGYGLISSPMYQSFGTLGYNPNIQYSIPYGGVLQYGNNNGFMNNYFNPYFNLQQPQQQNYTYMESGYNPSGCDKMYAAEDLDKVKSILNNMAEEQQAYSEKMLSVYPGYNYYGYMNSYNPFMMEKYKQEQYKIDQEAIQRRIDFNKMLSRIAHNYLEDEVSDEYYSIYDQQEVTVQAEEYNTRNSINRLKSFTVNVSELYINQYNYANNCISQDYTSDTNTEGGLTEFLNNAGEIYARTMQNEVDKEKKNKTNIYDRNAFSKYLSSCIDKREGNLFPTLSQTSSIMDDGTLQIKAPSWITNNKKESEKSFEQDKQRFMQCIYNGGR